MPKKSTQYATLNSMLAGIERMFLTIILAFVPPILLSLAGWWGSLPFVPEKSIMFFALGGLLLGIMVDLLFLRRWSRAVLSAPLFWPVLVFLFYSFGMFGFFMGVPVFNWLMGPLGGYYMGMRLRAAAAPREQVDKSATRTAIFVSGVFALACLASWLLAAFDPSLEANISGMFKLAAPLSRSMILALSAATGLVLIFLEYLISRAAVHFARFL
jgi:hypothetical protein